MQQYLVMYTIDNKTFYCLSRDWEKQKRKMKGRVEYMFFAIRNCSPTVIARKILECMEGTACPVKGGHVCLR